MLIKGRIFDIQSFSLHDGPGCRTTIFMSGCPLKCRWCANPESWRSNNIMFSEGTCKYRSGCNICKNSCTRGGLKFDENNRPILNFEICKECSDFNCANACYYDALKYCSREYSIEGLMKILQRDSNNWRGNGGVTFSGGEPLMQNEFLIEVLKRCKEKKFHTAIETSAYQDTDIFNEVMQYVDFAFIDIKHMNRKRHKEKTGVCNDIIKENIVNLAKLQWDGRLVLRIPMIGGFNDNIENIHETIDFMHCNDLVEINLLPFHRLGESKWNQLGNKYEYSTCGDIDKALLNKFQDMFLEEEIACYIGDDTLGI
ncbi:4-hydroxyphenylacetate decarboxylase activase [Clostridium senegalense]|uniref:4-hydroxyphenylacetate decarboxylase activase n=1 Tax=Clostridium senegalense TaxID=1465809 RepID=A0A6M0H6I7_9CLOT|nr:4-hydroxyphenylacetate decarboxylase activase [Clostridium senegalense]